jgi:hypothetical protein
MQQIYCLVNCGTDDAAFGNFMDSIQSFGFTCTADTQTTNIKGVISKSGFNSFLGVLDAFKFRAKFKIVPVH